MHVHCVYTCIYMYVHRLLKSTSSNTRFLWMWECVVLLGLTFLVSLWKGKFGVHVYMYVPLLLLKLYSYICFVNKDLQMLSTTNFFLSLSNLWLNATRIRIELRILSWICFTLMYQVSLWPTPKEVPPPYKVIFLLRLSQMNFPIFLLTTFREAICKRQS